MPAGHPDVQIERDSCPDSFGVIGIPVDEVEGWRCPTRRGSRG
jgi:hypothetical protein